LGIILAILVFGTLVVVHELGHFLLAKANGIRVDEFAIGMGPKLFSVKKGDTTYCIKLLPIGGSCMMGEDDVDDMSEGSFNSKSVWARIAVVAAGAIFNFILAFIFATIIVAYSGYDRPVISDVIAGYSAEAEGMQAGDDEGLSHDIYAARVLLP
jgi:regulator of sigma E protease